MTNAELAQIVKDKWPGASYPCEDYFIRGYRMAEDTLTAELERLKGESERLKVYKKTVYDYVQCTGNTSPETLGYHVAEALVLDHKKLKSENARLKERVRELEEKLDLISIHEGGQCGPGQPKGDENV